MQYPGLCFQLSSVTVPTDKYKSLVLAITILVCSNFVRDGIPEQSKLDVRAHIYSNLMRASIYKILSFDKQQSFLVCLLHVCLLKGIMRSYGIMRIIMKDMYPTNINLST